MRIVYKPSLDDPHALELAKQDGVVKVAFRLMPEPLGRGRKGTRFEDVSGDIVSGLASVEHRGVVFRRVTVENDADGKAVTKTSLRDVPLSEIREQIHQDLLVHSELLSWSASVGRPHPFSTQPLTPEERRRAKRQARSALGQLRATPKPRGRHGYDDHFLENIAVTYLHYTEIDRRRPAELLYEAFRKSGKHGNITRATVRKWVQKSRDAGWLAPATQGQVVAVPGPRLLAKRASD